MSLLAAATSGQDQPAIVAVSATNLPANQQNAVINQLTSAGIPAYAQFGAAPADQPDNLNDTVWVASCATIRSLGDSGLACSDTPVVVTDPTVPLSPDLQAGKALSIPLADGSISTVTVPNQTVSSTSLGLGNFLLIPPEQATWLAHVSNLTITFIVPLSGSSYDQLMATLAEQAPGATTSTGGGDPQLRATYLQQESMLRMLTAAGFFFCLAALVLLGVSLSQDQLRSFTALQLLGLRRSQLQRAMSLGKAFPIAVITIAIAVVTGLSTQSLISTTGVGGGLLVGLWFRSLGYAALGVIVTAIMGVLIVNKLDLRQPDARE